jgi:hypothetical protein
MSATSDDSIDLGTVGNDLGDEDAGQDIPIHDRRGEPMFFTPAGATDPVPLTIRVAGTYSKRYRRHIEGVRLRGAKQRSASLTADQLTQENLEAAAVCCVDWCAAFQLDGKPAACTRENAVKLLGRAPWIREQVEAAMGDHARFFKSGSSS